MSDWPDGWYRPDTGPARGKRGIVRRTGQPARMARAAARARGAGRACARAPRTGPAGHRAAEEVLGPAGPPRAADRPDRGPGRGDPGGGRRRVVLLPGRQAEPVGRAAGLHRPVRGAELADHRFGHPAGPVPAADRQPARRVRLRHHELRLPDAAAHRRRHAGAGQHPARFLRADPRPRHQQDQRGPRLRRADPADPDRGERHRAEHQPLHGHRVRRAGQRGEPGGRGADLPQDGAARFRLRRQPPRGLPDPQRRRRRWLSYGTATRSPTRTCNANRTSGRS